MTQPGTARRQRTAEDTPRGLVLAICCMSLFVVAVDATILNVALPDIQRDLSASVSGLQWTIDAYTLVLASLLMLSGSLGDRLGRRRVFQTGLALFTVGSLLCSVAPGLGWLVAFRMVQAVGGSMLNPVALAIVVNTFPEPRERARAIGVWGSVVGLSLALGPVLGGVLVTGVGWRSVFWVNIPVGLAAIGLTQRYVPESRAPRPRRLDPVAQVLIILALTSITYAIIEGPKHGWLSPLIIGLFGASAAAVALLVAAEARRHEPLITLGFFRSAPFSGATVLALAAFAALGGYLFLNTLYLQNVRGFSALHAGLLTLPLAVMAGVLAPVSGRLVGSVGPRLPLLLAGPSITVAALLLVRLSPSTPVEQLLASYLLFGIGFGLVNAPISNAAVSGMPREQAGVAAALASTSRQVGSTLGVAITGSLVGVATGTGFTAASHAAWAVIAGCGVAVLVVGLATTGPWALRTAERAADRLAVRPTGRRG